MRTARAAAPLAAAAAVVAVVACGSVAATSAANAAPDPAAPAATSTGTITRSAHVAFANCNAQHVLLSATAPRRPFTSSEEVAVTVRLRNTGNTSCGDPLPRHAPPARQALRVGPCGNLPLVVRNSQGVAVYPGPAVFHCPEASGLGLGPHRAVQATAYWDQTAYLGTRATPKPEHAPPGIYRLTVDQAVTVPVTLGSSGP